jgi:signal peptidase II
MTTRLVAWLGLAALVVVVDQLTKLAVTRSLTYDQSIAVTPFFDLVVIYNPGAAFSFLSDASGWQRWFFVVLALVISVWLLLLLRRHAAEKLLPLALALILGGAIGNVIDRILFGAVIDFLYFHLGKYYWPAFNVADSAISVGVVLMIWDQIRPRAAKASGAGAADRGGSPGATP